MKYLTTILLFLWSGSLMSQSISPTTNNEYCPFVEYNFWVNLPKGYKNFQANIMLITQSPNNFSQDNKTFSFKAKFIDQNQTQTIIFYDSVNNPYTFNFTKVKYFHYQGK